MRSVNGPFFFSGEAHYCEAAAVAELARGAARELLNGAVGRLVGF